MHAAKSVSLAVAFVVAACSPARPSASPSEATGTSATAIPSVGPSPAGTPDASPTAPPLHPAPYVPGPAVVPFGDPITVRPGLTSDTTTEHGIRVTIRADAASFSSADGLWVSTTLENLGDTTVRWFTDGCVQHVAVSAFTAVDWAYGAAQPGLFATFKDWALDVFPGQPSYPIFLRSDPAWAVDKGDYGCADLAIGHKLAPGGRIRARHLVRAITGREGKYGLPPAGPVLLTATFDHWRRGKGDAATYRGEPVVARLAVVLEDGRDPALLSPGQAIDVALGSPMIQALLRAHPTVPEFTPTHVVLDATAEEWRIGFTFGARTREEIAVTVVVDARNAIILRADTPP